MPPQNPPNFDIFTKEASEFAEFDEFSESKEALSRPSESAFDYELKTID